jgi:hypothetical protein
LFHFSTLQPSASFACTPNVVMHTPSCSSRLFLVLLDYQSPFFRPTSSEPVGQIATSKLEVTLGKGLSGRRWFQRGSSVDKWKFLQIEQAHLNVCLLQHNSSFLGAIKNIVTAPLGWFSIYYPMHDVHRFYSARTSS